MLIAVNYHYVRESFDSPYPSIHGVTPAQLETQLKILGECGVFVDAERIRAAIRGHAELPERSIIVTFDDGLREQYVHAWPVLQRLGIPGMFFINTKPIVEGLVSSVHKIHILRSELAPAEFLKILRRYASGENISLERKSDNGAAALQYPYDDASVAGLKYVLNFLLAPEERDRLVDACFFEVFPDQQAHISHSLYMDPQQIAYLARHRCVGSHGHEHLPLGLLERGTAESLILESLKHLENWGGYRPFAMSYPYGSRDACGREVGQIAARLGIEFAFTIEKAGNGPENLAHPLLLARFDANDLPGGKTPLWTTEELFSRVPASRWYAEQENLHAD